MHPGRCAVCGLWILQLPRHDGEQLLWAWIKSEILMPKRLVFKSDCLYYQVMQPAIAEGCMRKRATHQKKTKRRKHMKKNEMTKTPEARH